MEKKTIVRFPAHLIRHYDAPSECEAVGDTIAELIHDLERQFPGLTAYLVEENGTLRKHVNIFIDNQLVRDRESLSDKLEGVDEVYVMQALSGG